MKYTEISSKEKNNQRKTKLGSFPKTIIRQTIPKILPHEPRLLSSPLQTNRTKCWTVNVQEQTIFA